jgi:hypothetical protein
MPACPERHRAPGGLRARACCRASSEGQEGTAHSGESSDWGSRIASSRLPVASSQSPEVSSSIERSSQARIFSLVAIVSERLDITKK